MINICLQGHDFKNEVFDIVRLFYRDGEIEFVDEPREEFRGLFILSRLINEEGLYFVYYEAKALDKSLTVEEKLDLSEYSDNENYKKRLVKRALKRFAYILLSKLTGEKMPWGMLTGIRPAKIVRELIDSGLSKEKIFKQLDDYYMVSEEKAKLAYAVASIEKRFIDRTTPDMIAVYIGIPFCPTRCLYCSFTSSPIAKYRKSVTHYLEALYKEIDQVSEIIKEKNYKIQSIYIGGGTPTSLDSQDLRCLLQHIGESLDTSYAEEFTLEAGRPDSINLEKLCVIKDSKVNRISINPQSMNEETLKLIGRNHTPKDIEECFWLAREVGFDNINMDVIAGLPGESFDMFRHSLDELRQLRPESITVHTMSIKRASRLKEEKEKYNLKAAEDVEAMVEYAQNMTKEIGMHPYYLYRQKNILGNLENVGYCLPGKESVYNIQIMEERQTILALGAGAITKVVYSEENRLERAFNVKSVEEYIARTDEMVERKKALLF